MSAKSPQSSSFVSQFIQNHSQVLIAIILILAVVLRFINYSNRWGLAYDQAHDAVLARYALSHFRIPLLGPFSSAGPFQTSGVWYWFIMFGTALFPFVPITPWIVLTSLYVIFVLFIFYVGEKIVNTEFGLIVALLAAVSPAQISQSVNLTNQSPLACVALIALWFGVLFIRTKKIRFIFLSAFFASLGSSIHLQGAELGIIPILSLILSFPFSISAIGVLLAGFIIPWTPVALADSQNHFLNFRNMIYYFFHDQYRISLDVLGRRWKTYLLVFWPDSWGKIIGGYVVFGYLSMIGAVFSGIFLAWPFARRTFQQFSIRKNSKLNRSFFHNSGIQKEWILVCGSFLIMFFYLRYVRTPLYDSYLVFLHPFVLFITAGCIYVLYRFGKMLGAGVLLLFVLGSIVFTAHDIRLASNFTSISTRRLENLLIQKYPGQKFAIYDFKNNTGGYSLPLSLYLDSQGKIDDNGIRIGFGYATRSGQFKFPILSGENVGLQIFDLSSSSSAVLQKAEWKLENPSRVYHQTEEWYK